MLLRPSFTRFLGSSCLTVMSIITVLSIQPHSFATQHSQNKELKATVNNWVRVNVKEQSSDLDKTLEASDINAQNNIPSTDFEIRGDVQKNSSSDSVQCMLSTLQLILSNGPDNITVHLTGTIGGTTIDTNPFNPAFASKKADIIIDGDLDEATATVADDPGTYSGTVTITATII